MYQTKSIQGQEVDTQNLVWIDSADTTQRQKRVSIENFS